MKLKTLLMTGIQFCGLFTAVPLIFADDHGNTAASATLMHGNTLNGNIETIGDIDYFRINVTREGSLTAWTAGNLDTVGTLFNENEQWVAENDDWADAEDEDDYNFRIIHNVVPGIYFLKVEAYDDGLVGAYQLSYSLAWGGAEEEVGNNDFAEAYLIEGRPIDEIIGKNFQASLEFGEINPRGKGGSSVWWEWTAPSSGHVTVNTFGSDFNTLLSIQQIIASNLKELVNDDDSGDSLQSKVTFLAVAQTTYYIAVHGYEGAQGNVEMLLCPAFGAPPDPPDPADLNHVYRGEDLGSVASGTFNARLQNSLSTAWWQWTPSNTNLATFDTVGSDSDTVLAVYTGNSIDTLTRVRYCDDSNDDSTSRVAFVPTSGVNTYYVAVRSSSGDPGDITLNLTSTPRPRTSSQYIAYGRASLERQTADGLAQANNYFKEALARNSGSSEANLLAALTQLALLQQQAAMITLIDKLGIIAVDTDIYSLDYEIPRDENGDPVAVEGSNTSDIIDYLNDTLLEGLDNFQRKLARITKESFLVNLSDSETASLYVALDFADIKYLKAAGYAAQCMIHLLTTYDTAVSLEKVAQLHKEDKVSAQDVLGAFGNLLNLTETDRRGEFKSAFQKLNSSYKAGSDFVRKAAGEELEGFNVPVSGNLFYLKDARNRKFLELATDALNGPTQWGGETVDLSRLLTTTKGLRDFLPSVRGNRFVANTIPDVTFDGVLPNGNREQVESYLDSRGLLYDISTFFLWSEKFLSAAPLFERLSTSDPDLDGISNFLEFTFGLDPLDADDSTTFFVPQLLTSAMLADDFGDLTLQIKVSPIAAGGYHSLVVQEDGLASAWGRNNYGQSLLPGGLENLVAIFGGFYHSLALQGDGGVVAWGDNRYGQADVPAEALTGVVAIAAGAYHNLALHIDGSLVVWGRNHLGQRSIPSKEKLGTIQAIATGAHHNMVLRADGTVYAWGYNGNRQTDVPAALASTNHRDFVRVIAIEGGALHSLALRENGTVVAWGDNTYGQRNVPTALQSVDHPDFVKITDISAGGYHNLALREDGTLVAWGRNNSQQRNVPEGLDKVAAISAGLYHNMALREDGTLVAWGRNDDGQTDTPQGILIAKPGISGDSKDRFLTVTFRRRIDTDHVTYVVAVSDDLVSFDETGIQVEQVGEAMPTGDGITESVTFRIKDSVSISDTKFMRVIARESIAPPPPLPDRDIPRRR
jgi:alpha-tubulin suppressor-like RCC1 family protein